jgi:polar amino acid transport system substrate-binding protein
MLFKRFIMGLIIAPILAHADTFKVVGIEGAPLRFYDDTHTLVGIDVDILDTIMRRLKVSYDIEIVKSSTRLKYLWQDPDVDMILTYSYKPERAEHLYYPKQSHVTLSWNFFILKENIGKFDYTVLTDLQGLKIGATNGFSYTKAFWDAAASNVFELDTVVKNDLNMNKLLRGRFDTYANSRIDTLYQAKKGGYFDKITYLKKPLKEKAYFNTFVRVSDYPGMEDIKRSYDIELDKMRKSGELERIYAKYLGDESSY